MMALQWLMWCAAAVVLTMLVQPAEQQSSCDGNYNGLHGIPGANGPHGADGPKGEKGDSGGAHLLGRKGEIGDRGSPGRTGPKGDPGPEGSRGLRGPKGERGRPRGGAKHKSFFSYKRENSQPPQRDRPIVFSSDVVPNLSQFLRGDNLTSGEFQCNIKGLYYFTYHISAKDLVCLKLMKGTVEKLSFCDSSSSHLVTSGSVVLDLSVGDRVSLQPSIYNKIVASPNLADNTFTGMLLFPTT